MAPEAQELVEIVEAVIHQKQTLSRISPSWIATEVMLKLDPDRSSVPLVFLGCHLQIRQIARGILRKHFEDYEVDADEQHEMFPELQRRYPIAKANGTNDPQYVLLEDLTIRDIHFNVYRLRREGNAKLKHADALEAYAREHMGASHG